MKRLLYLVLAWLALAGCEDEKTEYMPEPVFDITDVQFVLPATGKTTDNSIITTNMDWTISGANEWCSVSPESGHSGTTMVYFTVADHEGFSDRNINLTLEVGGKKTILTIIQKKKDALTISQDKFVVPSKGENIAIKVDANIDFFVDIPAASSWIKQQALPAAKGLETTDVAFTVEPNPEGEKREGMIIIHDELRRLSDTIRVYQGQKNMLVLTQNHYRVPSEGREELIVQLRTNLEYETRIPSEYSSWIHVLPETRALMRTDVVRLGIGATDEDRREGYVVFKDKNSELQDTVFILQVPQDAIIVKDEEIKVAQAGGQAEFEVSSNVGYEVIIHERVDWIRQIPSSRAMEKSTLAFQVEPNPEEQIERRARIVLKGTGEEEVADTVYIRQEGRPRLDNVGILRAIFDALDGENWYKTSWFNIENEEKRAAWWDWSGIKTIEVDGERQIVQLTVPDQAKGEVPSVIGDLQYLESLVITPRENQGGKLTGRLPAELGKLTRLKVLKLTGEFVNIPDEIWQLENLEELVLESTSEEINAPDCIGELRNLKKLTLYCLYNGPIPASFGNLSNLTTLDIGKKDKLCRFTSIPSEIGGMRALKKLTIYSSLEGAVLPPEIGQLENLTNILIKFTGLRGIPDEIGNLKKLSDLDLQNNKIEAIPAGIGGCESLKILRLNQNVLSGSIPPEIGELKNLQYLYLQGNQLTGSIPVELGNMENLQTLQLDTNKLSGTIPFELGNLSQLSRLYLSKNKLTGSIPSSLFTGTKINYLYLSHNQLTGGIPGEIISAKATLGYFYADNNRLSGDFPPEFAFLKLTSLNLENNNITGTIPEDILENGNFKPGHSWFVLNGNRMKGKIPESVLIRMKEKDHVGKWLITEQQDGYGFDNAPQMPAN